MTKKERTGKAAITERLVVFTDLDGTLLDHHSYRWEAAKPALDALSSAGIPVVLTSSKTRSEISALRVELDNSHPYIVENGAAVVIPDHYFGPGIGQELTFGTPREEILPILEQLREAGFRFRNFAALSVAELARLTGLPEAGAAAAKRRAATEPVLWEDDDAALERFRERLVDHHLQLVAGGRFHHVMGHFDKADAMTYLMNQYRTHYNQKQVTSIALGDSPNDLRMLEAADIPVVIQSSPPGRLELPGNPRVVYSQEPGPGGWNQCILDILADRAV